MPSDAFCNTVVYSNTYFAGNTDDLKLRLIILLFLLISVVFRSEFGYDPQKTYPSNLVIF